MIFFPNLNPKDQSMDDFLKIFKLEFLILKFKTKSQKNGNQERKI